MSPPVEREFIADVPVISICIPAYREVAFLRRAIASCLIQSYTDFEVVVTDDTEDDSVFRLVEQMAAEDRRIRYFRNPGPHGAAANSNYSVKRARGYWIKFLYQDDEFVSRESLQLFLNNIDRGNFIFSSCFQIKDDKIKSVHSIDGENLKYLYGDPVRHLLKMGNIIGSPSVILIKKSLFCNFEAEMQWKFDLFLYVKMLLNGVDLVYIREPLIRINEHERQLTNKVFNSLQINHFESLKILKYIKNEKRHVIYCISKIILLKIKFIRTTIRNKFSL